MINGQPFVDAARAQTMMLDINKLRKAARSCDMIAADEALDKCERWFSQLSPSAPVCICRGNDE